MCKQDEPDQLIADAAEAVEIFGEDELERYAGQRNLPPWHSGWSPEQLEASRAEAREHGHSLWSHAVAYGPCTKPTAFDMTEAEAEVTKVKSLRFGPQTWLEALPLLLEVYEHSATPEGRAEALSTLKTIAGLTDAYVTVVKNSHELRNTLVNAISYIEGGGTVIACKMINSVIERL